MDGWQVATNYIAFTALAGSVGLYYLYSGKPRQPAAGNRRRSINEQRGKGDRRGSVQRTSDESLVSSGKEPQNSDSTSSRKRRAPKKQQQPAPTQSEPEVLVQDEKPEKESDISIAQFAQQMTKARQGANLSSTKSKKDTRVRTVKQSSAQGNAEASTSSSQAAQEHEADVDDDSSSADSEALNAGDVADMLEPKASGPKSLRLTESTKPRKERAPKQAKMEVVETKKQRQNRKKVEERRVQREEEEKERKVLEEKQRRAARQSRGEPAKNGIPIAKAPVNNPWEEKNASAAASVQSTAPVSNGTLNGPLLDTFDAESTGSSAGGMEASTAATSTTEGGNEDEQIARAMKESGDESGWTTVDAAKKKGKKSETSADAASQEKPKTAAPSKSVKPAPANIPKPRATGYAALNVDDPSDWDA